MDDASSDASYDIGTDLLSRQPIPTKFIKNTINSSSPFKQWNKGAESSTGDYLWIAETDDFCDDRLLASLYEAMITTDSVLAYSLSRYVDTEGKQIGTPLHWLNQLWPCDFEKSNAWDGQVFIRRYLKYLNVIPNASSVLVRKDVFTSVLPLIADFKYCGDWLAWIKVASVGRIAYVSKPLNSFRGHPSTTRSRFLLHQLQAEILACQLKAHALAVHQKEARITAFTLIDQSRETKPAALAESKGISPGLFFPILQCYRSLVGTTPISLDGWLFLFVSGFGPALLRRVRDAAYGLESIRHRLKHFLQNLSGS